MKTILIALVQTLSKLDLSPISTISVAFNPTCSNYMIQAIERFGVKGVLMGTCEDSYVAIPGAKTGAGSTCQTISV
ncbi:MAG: membrane protein insertion efficiency factor YidD [Streptococcus parasanguinis]